MRVQGAALGCMLPQELLHATPSLGCLLTMTGSAGGSAAAGPRHACGTPWGQASVWHYDRKRRPVGSANAPKPLPEVHAWHAN
mmetsp:Transcript_44074/g.87451  ORF Transcript_44074/g.87451 Transcript_44074/m.87451 type:complete len:83 (+) Transcript_44074:249-497(+)